MKGVSVVETTEKDAKRRTLRHLIGAEGETDTVESSLRSEVRDEGEGGTDVVGNGSAAEKKKSQRNWRGEKQRKKRTCRA